MNKTNNQSFWSRLKTRRRIAVMDDDSLKQLWSFRLSALGVIIMFVLMFLVTVAVLSVIIIYTPMRNILPGYNQNIREQLMEESVRLDSLSNAMGLQRQYLEVIRSITAGEVSTDTVPGSDSLQLIFQEQLLEAKREATEDFVAQYEQKEKDNLQLFDIQNTAPAITLTSPVLGTITQHFLPQDGYYDIAIQTAEKASVMTVLAGTIVWQEKALDDTYTIIVQHQNYISVYRNVGYATHKVGDALRSGETIGLMTQPLPLRFELWKEGYALNPEEVIAF